MQIARFEGFCPYEIGDKIVFKGISRVLVIEDIRTIHYLKNVETFFEVMTDAPSLGWLDVGRISKRIVE